MKRQWAGAKWMRGGLLVAAVLGSGCIGARLWAQSGDDAGGATSAEDAAKMFVVALSMGEQARMDGILEPLISLDSVKNLGDESLHSRLWVKFVTKMKVGQWQAETAPGEDADRAVVQVEPAYKPQLPEPVVCVREGNVWKVDFLETARRWFGPDDPDMKLIEAELRGEDPLNRKMSSCQSNLKQMGLAMMMYAQDYDEKFVPANKWCDELKPYLKTEDVFHCPQAGKNNYGYAMNWKLSRRNMDEVEDMSSTVLFYESDVLKRNQNGDGKDLTFRHMVKDVLGTNYAFADGHVKWFNRDEPQNFRLAPLAASGAKAPAVASKPASPPSGPVQDWPYNAPKQ